MRGLTHGVKRLGIELDHVTVELRRLLGEALPGVELVDIAGPAMRLRMVKSGEEIAHIARMAHVADLGRGLHGSDHRRRSRA